MAVGGAILAALGLILLAIWLWDGYHKEFRPRFLFEEAQCHVVSKRFAAFADKPGSLGLPVFDLEVLARGRSYRARGYDLWKEGMPRAEAEVLLSRFDLEKRHPCWFDPADPPRAVLARTHNLAWILCGVFLVLPSNALGAFLLIFVWRKIV